MALARTWNHTICEVCWFARDPERYPVQVKREEHDFSVDECCFCSQVKLTRIYVRQDPASPALCCGGEHDDDDTEGDVPEPG